MPDYIYGAMAGNQPGRGAARDPYADLMRYYQDFLNKFWGGTPLITPQQETYFSEQAKWMREASGQMEQRAMENLAARGVTRAGIGTDYLGKYVYQPLAQAEAQLGSQRAELIAQEQTRRQEQALSMAMQKQQEEQEKRAGTLGTLGRLFGTGVGAIAGSFIGQPLLGASIGGSLFGGGGGGGGGTDWQLLQQIMAFRQQNPNATQWDYLNQSGNYPMGGQYGYGYSPYMYGPFLSLPPTNPYNPYYGGGGNQ